MNDRTSASNPPNHPNRRQWVARRLRRFALILLIGYVTLIVVLSLLPGPDLPATSMSDKLQHVIAYAIMSALTAIAFGLGRSPLRPCLVSLILANVVGIGIEFIQPHFGRTFDLADMLANAIGATGGAILIAITLHLSRPIIS